MWDRVEDGTLSLEFVHRLSKEYYWLGKFYTMEFGSLVANAPDNDALQAGTSEHFLHWAQNLSDEMGFAGDPNHGFAGWLYRQSRFRAGARGQPG